MAKRSDTLETVLLAVELLRRIPRGRKVTASDLHRQLKDAGIDRDLRTIQRQLEMLSEHFEIERDDRSKPYGYRWLEQAKALAVPNLTPQESLLLQLAEDHLRNFLPARLMKSMEGFFSQARRNLGPDSNARLEREWPGKVRVVATSQPLLPPKIVPGIFEVVSEALYSNRWLQLDYRNSAGKQNQVEVMPLGLVQQGSRFYLVCRYRGYDNERNLALHRILSAEMSTLSFERPKEFDLKKYDDDGRFGFGDGEKIRLVFCIERNAGLHLLESPLSKDQQVVKLEDGTLEITATVVDSAMLEWWLRGFGDAVSRVRKLPNAMPSYFSAIEPLPLHIVIAGYSAIGQASTALLQQDRTLSGKEGGNYLTTWMDLDQATQQKNAVNAIRKADVVFILGDNTQGGSALAARQIAQHCAETETLCYALLCLPAEHEQHNPDQIQLQKNASNTLVILQGSQTDTALATHLAAAVLNVLHPITRDGLIGVDFADIRTVLTRGNQSVFFVTEATGDDRAKLAAHAALAQLPDVSRALSILCNITCGFDLKLEELNVACKLVGEKAPEDCTMVASATVLSDCKEGCLQVGMTVVFEESDNE